uniref:Uncharacterized protein n=1 Tax=Nelumbo nucifera TaxID=4432 RepID=A0A822XGT4_NELNU|nr:TPA_asm: hypothetical protein HUJ06_020615 [Nelumbo nucifera]
MAFWATVINCCTSQWPLDLNLLKTSPFVSTCLFAEPVTWKCVSTGISAPLTSPSPLKKM